MDDSTKKMLVTVVGPILRKLLITAGSALATHGIINSSQTETFVSIGMALIGLGWSFWNDYGRAIVLSQLEVLKAKSLAQAAKLQQHDIAPPTVEQIADKSATLTTAQVTKVAATLCLLLAFGLMAGPAFAQTQAKRFVPTGNLGGDIGRAVNPAGTAGGNNGALQDLMTAFDNKLKPDLEFALAIAKKSGNQQTGACWQAWLDQIAARQNANVDAQGNPLTPPDPHLITDFQKIMDLRNALQSGAPFFQACTPIAITIKMDITKFIGLVVSGGAGLMALVPGL